MPEIILKEADVIELQNILGEIPYKYSAPLVVFFQKRISQPEPVADHE